MMTLQMSLTVEIPQLDALRATLEHIGVQLMADFSALTTAITDLTATLDQELAEIQDLLQQDSLDQAQINNAAAMLGDIRTRLAGAVTPATPPTPPPA